MIHDGIIDKLTVSSVNEASGSAEITGELTGTLVNGTKAEVIYPYSAVDLDKKALKADLIKEQEGSLKTVSEKLDVRQGNGTLVLLSVGDTQYASFDKGMSLYPKYAFIKFTLTGDNSSPVNATKFVMKDIEGDANDILTTVTPTDAAGSSELFVAIEKANIIKNYQFDITIGSKTYQIVKRSGTYFQPGYIYRTEFKLDDTGSATIKTFDPSEGKFVDIIIPGSITKTMTESDTKWKQGTYVIDNDITINKTIT